MKHIQTVSKAESSMRELYKVATDGSPVVADESQMTSINKIIEYTRQMDLLKAEISEEIGKIMGAMQGHSVMVDPDGTRTLVSWKNSSTKVKVDYDAMILELNIPPATVERFTKRTPGARVFKIED